MVPNKWIGAIVGGFYNNILSVKFLPTSHMYQQTEIH